MPSTADAPEMPRKRGLDSQLVIRLDSAKREDWARRAAAEDRPVSAFVRRKVEQAIEADDRAQQAA